MAAPLRAITKRVTLFGRNPDGRRGCVGHGSTQRLWLSCGHKVVIKSSAAPRYQVRCKECARAAINEGVQVWCGKHGRRRKRIEKCIPCDLSRHIDHLRGLVKKLERDLTHSIPTPVEIAKSAFTKAAVVFADHDRHCEDCGPEEGCNVLIESEIMLRTARWIWITAEEEANGVEDQA